MRGHDGISRLHVRAGEASCNSGVPSRSSLLFWQVTSRLGITMIFFCEALSQVVSFKPWIFRCHERDRRNGRTLWISFICARLSASRQAKPAFATVTLPFPSISVSASVALSASMLRRICDGGICGGTLTVSVSLPFSSLASWHRCSTHRNTIIVPFKGHTLPRATPVLNAFTAV